MVEQATFIVKRIDKTTVQVSFNYSFVSAETQSRLQKKTFVILKMLGIAVS